MDQAGEPKETVRIAIWKDSEGVDTPGNALQVEIARPDGTNLSIRASTPRSPSGNPLDIQAIVAEIGRWLEALDPESRRTEKLKTLSNALQTFFSDRGFHTSELPSGDLNIEISIDVKTGRTIGRQEVLHRFAGRLDGIEQRVQSVMLSLLSGKAAHVRERISLLRTAGDVEGVVREALAADAVGHFDIYGLPSDVLPALGGISVETIAAEIRTDFLLLRVKLYERVHDLANASVDADSLLRHAVNELNAEQLRSLAEISALGDAARGATETARVRLADLLRDRSAPAEVRAWTLRNMALTLGKREPVGIEFARMSFDAFVEAGQVKEALRSVALFVQKSLAFDPDAALSILDEISAIVSVGGNNLERTDHSSAILTLRAEVELRNYKFRAALDHALEAAKNWRDILGTEKERLRALGIARAAATSIGESEIANAISKEVAVLIARDDQSASLTLRERAAALAENFEPAEAELLEKQAELNGDRGLQALVMTSRVLFGEVSVPADRLRVLESARGLLSPEHDAGDLLVVDVAIARELLLAEDHEGALRGYRDVLRRSPRDRDARQNVATILMKMERWNEAVRFFEDEVARFGPLPGLMYGLGRANFERGQYSDAATALHLAAQKATNGDVRRNATYYRDRALERGGKLVPPAPQPAPAFVDRKEWNDILREFSRFIGRSKRQRFWRRHSNKTRWRERPERFAQDLFVTFLQGKLGQRIEMFEELPNIGAGRLDVMVNLSGGLRVVVELKMLGGGSYSESYAFAGEDQIGHYLENTNTRFGYLLIFDARVKSWGKGIDPITRIPEGFVETIYVDVRRNTPSRHSRRRQSGGNP